MEQGSGELSDLRSLLEASDEQAHVRAVLFHREERWQLRHVWALIGAVPPDWAEQQWVYSSIILVACAVPARVLVPLCSVGSATHQVITLGSVEVTLPSVRDGMSVDHQPSFSRFDRLPLPVPTRDYGLFAADTSYPSQPVPAGMLVGDSSPSFTDLNSAWRAFTEGDFSLSGAQPLPPDLALLRMAEVGGWLGPVHVTATRLSVEVHGTEVSGCELELYGVTGRQTRRLENPGPVELELEDGLPAHAWLWLKRGTGWLDYRALDPRWPQALREDPRLTGVEIDIPVDPQTAVERQLASGEGPQLEYKSKLPGTAPSEKRTALKTATAFANGAGGTIIFGVDPDEVTVVGLGEEDPGQLRDRLGDLIRASVIPTPSFDVRPYNVDGKTILVLTIEASLSPPYGLATDPNSRNKPEFFVRRGANTYPAQPSDLREATLNHPATAEPPALPPHLGW